MFPARLSARVLRAPPPWCAVVLALTAVGIALAATPAPASGDSKRRCGRVDGNRMTAYNMPCKRARRVWRRLPAGWTGANLDVDGGWALLFRQRDYQRVLRARTRRGFSLRRLNGAPLVHALVPYGE